MPDQVDFVGVSWESGWLHFVITPDSHVDPTGYAVKTDQARENQVNLSATAWPPGFTQTQRNQLESLLATLSAEWSKQAINAASVVLVDRVFWESGYQPAAQTQPEEVPDGG